MEMDDYQIVCRNTEHPHSHIVDVGTGDGDDLDRMWTVDEVIEAMKTGETFHTISPSSGERAEVNAFMCLIQGCTVMTLRTTNDLSKDNNLDNLSTCAI